MAMPEFTTAPTSSNDTLLTALFIAAVVHVIVLLGVSFVAPEPLKVDKALEITLSNTPVKKAPKHAKFLAKDHQLGAGDENRQAVDAYQPPRPEEGDAPVPAPRTKSSPAPATESRSRKVLTQKKAPEKLVAHPEATVYEVKTESVQAQPSLTAEALQAQIAELGQKIREGQQASENTRIKFINSVSTHKYMAAQYIKDWESKVERIGNLNFPEMMNQKGFSAKLTLDVGINTDGSIYSMKVSRSSGYPELDEAAKRIVRISAPFAPLPADLRQELDVLVISRVWQFSDELGMTTAR